MTMQVKDLPENLNETVATRLRLARDAAGRTRATVTTETGIPAKSIEKFENGHQEPSVSRLVTLCTLYGVSVDHILGQNNDPITPELNAIEQGMAAASDEGLSKTNGPAAILNELDAMRANSFVLSKRRAMALVDELVRQLRFLEPDELLRLAGIRGIYKGECQDIETLIDFFFDDPDKGQKYCGLVEERIIDTAVIGVDLYTIELASLEHLIEDLAISPEGFDDLFSEWNGHDNIIPEIRTTLRGMSIAGNAPDFNNLEKLPRRQ